MPKVQIKDAPVTADIPSIGQFEGQILAAWADRLKQNWAGGKQRKFDLFQAVIESRHHALAYLLSRLEPAVGNNGDDIISRTIERIQSEDFDISDLFCEIRYLYETINEILPRDLVTSLGDGGNNTIVRQNLDDFFETVARETSVVYEFFAERGTQPFFILDQAGDITYSNNSARQLIGASAHAGALFKSCLEPEDQQRFEQMLHELKGSNVFSPVCATVQILGTDANKRSITIELARLEHATERSVFYLSLSPASRVLGVEDEALERFDQGIIRVDSSNCIYYANQAARRLIGQDNLDVPFQPIYVHDLFVEEDKAKINAELQKRKHGELSRYEIKLTQASGHKIPVCVYAIPELNSAGEHIGSVAIIRNLVEERASSDFNDCLVDGDSWKDDLERLSKLLFKYIDADIITVYRYTNDLKFVSMIDSFTRSGEAFAVDRRWFSLSPALIDWNSQDGIKRYADFPEFVENPVMSELANDPDIQGMVANGIKSFMASPIFPGGDNRAGLSFLAMDFDRFTQADEDLMSQIPIEDVVLSAIQRKDSEEKAFQFRLMAKLSQCTSFKDVAHRITKDLARHYGWDNVSLFDVIEDIGQLTLIRQYQGSDVDYVLPDDYIQDSNKGLLGKAVREKSLIYEPDVSKSKDFYQGHPKIKSELIIPIFSRMYEPARVFWLLNVEDSHTDLLIDSEIRELEEIAEHLEFVVNRIMDRVTYEHALKNTSDGIIVTDANGDIRYVNPASFEMLEYDSPDDLIGKNVTGLFLDKHMGRQFIRENFRDSYNIELHCRNDNNTIHVLLSKLELPVEISDRYFVFKNLEAQRRLADLEAIERLVGDIANQVKTPLSLVHGMLHRLTSSDGTLNKVSVGNFVERSRNMLKKVELTYDRVAYSEPITSSDSKIETYIHLDRIFEKINQELSDDQVLDVRIKGNLKPISGDRHQIRFVLESLVSHLLRNLAKEEKISVDINADIEHVDVHMHASPANADYLETAPDTTDWDRTLSEVSFGQTAVRKIVSNHGGIFNDPIIDDKSGCLGFKLTFPTE